MITCACQLLCRLPFQDEHGHTIHDPRALDPREAIIAHAEAAKKNPFYTAVRQQQHKLLSWASLTAQQAYAKTQPKAIYQQQETDGR